ncbi:MAG: hypothetical protein QME79_14775 [Bacillota bacterium]|nr:hypothetical protein [Bacillota bacterium]
MTVLYGESLKAVQGTKIDASIAYAPPRETLLGTPETLPTSEPASAQVAYTVEASDLPALPAGIRAQLCAAVFVASKNVDASSKTLYYKLLKNSVQTYTGSTGVSSGYWLTVECRFCPVSVGDLLEVKLWANGNMQWDYKALFVAITRPFVGKPLSVLRDLVFYTQPYPALIGGNPAVAGTSTWRFYVSTGQETYDYVDYNSVSYPAVLLHQNYGLGQHSGYPAGNTFSFGSSTYRPYYFKYRVPTQIVGRLDITF